MLHIISVVSHELPVRNFIQPSTHLLWIVWYQETNSPLKSIKNFIVSAMSANNGVVDLTADTESNEPQVPKKRLLPASVQPTAPNSNPSISSSYIAPRAFSNTFRPPAPSNTILPQGGGSGARVLPASVLPIPARTGSWQITAPATVFSRISLIRFFIQLLQRHHIQSQHSMLCQTPESYSPSLIRSTLPQELRLGQSTPL